MKHITYADKSLLVGDTTADLMMQYAAVLAEAKAADALEVHCISSDGDEVIATFLLEGGAPLMTETTTSTLPEPDNETADAHMRDRISALTDPAPAKPTEESSGSSYDDLDLA